MAKRYDVEVRLWVDPKEQDIRYVDEILKSAKTKDGIEFVDYVVKSIKNETIQTI